MKREHYSFFLLMVLFVSLGLIVFQEGTINGRATQISFSSNVTISQSLAIAFSSDLNGGIIFDDVHILPATNVNAGHNYDGVNNGTKYYVLVSPDGNTDVDLCIKADGDLLSEASDVLGLGNETYSSALSTNLTSPSLTETPLTLNYVKVGSTIPIGNSSYIRFWLDVPAGQAAGTYNNSVYFKGNSVGLGC